MENLESQLKSQAYQPNSLLAGRFKLIQKLAIGGMGNVYKALDLERGSLPVAIKILHQQLAMQPNYVHRFSREVDLCSMVSHPNVVKILDRYKTKDEIFFTMELIEGESLEYILNNKTLSTQAISKILVQICDGLRAIHEAGIIHRDLKSGNIMLQKDSSVKIIDFGISRDENSRLTKKGIKLGSLAYMAPELWQGKAASIQSDFYSLGCLLYEMCVGEAPFASRNLDTFASDHMNSVLPTLPAEYPLWFSELLLTLCAKAPENRPKNVVDIIDYIKKNSIESHSVQLFEDHMQTETLRSGQSTISVFPQLAVRAKKDKDLGQESKKKRKQLLFSLQATKSAVSDNNNSLLNSEVHYRKSKTITINLPKNSAFIFEFELPTKDFLALGVFLGSLNVFDWYLTRTGILRFGVHAEGNKFLKSLMMYMGPETALFVAKAIAITFVLILTIAARRSKAIKHLVSTLSFIYLFAAILPWIYILYYRGH